MLTELLRELNPDVSGHFLVEDPAKIVAEQAALFSDFSVVLASGLADRTLRLLAVICDARRIPLFIATDVGFFGCLRIVAHEHTGMTRQSIYYELSNLVFNL